MPLFRLEVMGRSLDLTEGVRAKLADPYWLLGRQWQMGEFRGDNAGQPVSVEMSAESYGLQSYQAGGERPIGLGASSELPMPLEAMLEAVPAPRAEASPAFRQLPMPVNGSSAWLKVTAFNNYVPDFVNSSRSTCQALRPPRAPQPRHEMLARHGVDGHAIREDLRVAEQVVSWARADRIPILEEVIEEWLTAMAPEANPAWNPSRLEYSATVATMTSDGEVALGIDKHHGSHLDWYSFDVVGDKHGLAKADADSLLEGQKRVSVPTPVSYAGQPASRWWEFEDGRVHLGDIQAGPTDFARLAVAEFAMTYSDDWFVVPLRLRTATLSRVRELTVTDSFGDVTTVEHVAALDGKGDRAMRLFELDGDRAPGAGRPPWLFLAPAVATSMAGDVLEAVELTRDEAANLGWAIERRIEGPMGRPIDRGREWFASKAYAQVVARDDPTPAGRPASYADLMWHHHLETGTITPWWIPLLPQRIDPTDEQVRLRRARMQQWRRLNDADAGALGELLNASDPMFIEEEEVPRTGASVERRWQFTRWTDGSVHVWLQNVKRLHAQERSSGLRWDEISHRPAPPE